MSKKVMTVDDSTIVRECIRLTLTQAGYNVFVASNGLEAMRILETCDIDMLVTALNMPVMNGIELIRKFRNIPGHRFTPVIILPAKNQEDLKLEGRKAGASGWVTKPFSPDALLSVTHMVCPVQRTRLNAMTGMEA